MPRYMFHVGARTVRYEAETVEEAWEMFHAAFPDAPEPGYQAAGGEGAEPEPGTGTEAEPDSGQGGGDASEFDVAGSTIPEVITWVEEDPNARVPIALEAEQGRGDAARSSLIATLQGMIGS